MHSPTLASCRRFVAAILIVCGGGAATDVHAEPLSPSTARELLREAQHDQPRAPGSYRETFDRDTKSGHVSQTTLLLITPDQRTFSRVERRVTVTRKPDQNRRIVMLTTPEGRWFVYHDAAILEPVANIESLLAAARRLLDTPALAGAEGDRIKQDQPYLAAALEVEQHGRYDRSLTNDAGGIVVITETYDDEGRRALEALSQRLFTDAKAQFNLAEQLLVTAYVGFVDVPAKLPAKYAFEIDATRGRLLRVTVTTFGGESRAQRAPNPHFVATPPLAEADFALPANLTRLRPRNQAEFIKVQREHER